MLHCYRRFISLFLAAVCVFSLFVFPVFSGENTDTMILHRSVVFHEDGSRDETVTILRVTESERSSCVGDKEKKHYSSTNELVWRVRLVGTFSYNGTTSSCTEAHTEIYFYKSGWSVVSENTTHSGNTASTSVILGKNVLGVTMPGAYVNLSLSCDKDGNLS